MTGKPITGLPLIDIIRSDICAFRLSHQFRRAQILLSRAWFTLFRREKMVVGTCLSIVYLGSVFGYMLGEATNEGIEVASVFGMGNMCTLLSNIQFVYFLFNNNQVFLREHSKGLYSCGLHWVVNDIPLLFLRSIQAIAYAVIIHEILVLRGGDAEYFFYLVNWIMFVVGTQLIETVVYILPDVRTAYRIVPALAFFLFYFSGIIVKPDMLPRWLAPWLPSVSVIRWLTQALLINEYQYNREAFPEFGPYHWSSYDFSMSVFGWGGKTKWYCLRVLVLNIIIYRVVYLIVSLYHVVQQKGLRSKVIKKIDEERIF